MQALKDGLTKVKVKLDAFGDWICDKYRGNRKKCRGTLVSLALLMLLAGLITGSFKWVDSVSQGAAINYTSNTIADATVSNYGSFLGLNTYYQTVPSTYFLLSFQNQPSSDPQAHVFGPIRARVMEGTLLEVQVHAKLRVTAGKMKAFFDQYGFQDVGGHPSWLVYIREKVKNVVVQQMAAFRFYQLSNRALSAAINTQFNLYETTTALSFPFTVRTIAINLRYPTQTLQANDTLGVRLLEQQSLLSQLNTQKTDLQSAIQKYESSAKGYAERRASIDATMANREEAVKLSSSLWSQGVQVFSDGVQHNSTLLQKYLQVYFNTLYNATYRTESLKPFQI